MTMLPAIDPDPASPICFYCMRRRGRRCEPDPTPPSPGGLQQVTRHPAHGQTERTRC
jgi:hypothetical protein